MNKHRNHANREDLAGEHPFGDTGQLILLIVFLLVWVIDSFILKYTTFTVKYVSLFIRIPLGAAILFLSGYMAKEGMRVVFGEERQVSCVISKGIFGLVRHPVYLDASCSMWV